MALLFVDSFDHYVTADLPTKYTSVASTPAIVAAAGRRSSACLRCSTSSQNVQKAVAASGATAILGAALKAPSGGTNGLLGFYDGGVNKTHVYLSVLADGSINVARVTSGSSGITVSGGTTLGTSAPGVFPFAVFNYLECKVLLHASAGTVTVKVNGATVLALTGVNTSVSGTTVWTLAFIGAPVSANFDWDDLYVCDGSGSAPWNDFLGDCRVDARFPTAAGATTGWTPSTGSNWQNVDDAAPDGDTTYNAATTVNLTDTFTVQDAPVVGATIFGVQHCLTAKKMDAGTASLAPVVRHSSTDNVGSNLNPGTAYSMALAINATNPGTSAAWVEADFNAAEFGYKKTV